MLKIIHCIIYYLLIYKSKRVEILTTPTLLYPQQIDNLSILNITLNPDITLNQFSR